MNDRESQEVGARSVTLDSYLVRCGSCTKNVLAISPSLGGLSGWLIGYDPETMAPTYFCAEHWADATPTGCVVVNSTEDQESGSSWSTANAWAVTPAEAYRSLCNRHDRDRHDPATRTVTNTRIGRSELREGAGWIVTEKWTVLDFPTAVRRSLTSGES